MADINRIIFTGRIGTDTELKTTPSGVSVCTFRLAVERTKAKDAEKAETDWLDIVTWRQQAEFVSRYFNKGKSIFVLGALQNRNWTDQNGQKHYDFEVVADEVSFVESKSGEDGGAANRNFQTPSEAPTSGAVYSPAAQESPAPFEDLGSDDDLPF